MVCRKGAGSSRAEDGGGREPPEAAGVGNREEGRRHLGDWGVRRFLWTSLTFGGPGRTLILAAFIEFQFLDVFTRSSPCSVQSVLLMWVFPPTAWGVEWLIGGPKKPLSGKAETQRCISGFVPSAMSWRCSGTRSACIPGLDKCGQLSTALPQKHEPEPRWPFFNVPAPCSPRLER